MPSLDRLSLSPSLVPVSWVCGPPIRTVGFPGGLGVKNWPANAEDVGLVPGSGRSPGERIHGQRGLAGYSPQGHRVGHGGGITQQQYDCSVGAALGGTSQAPSLSAYSRQRGRVKERRVVWGAGVSGRAQAALWGVLDVLVHPHCLCS